MLIQPNTIRWGFIGCGNVTEVKSGPAYQKTEGFDVVAVMRRDLAKARDYAQRHAIPKFYDDAQTLINDTDVDAVYIATPPDSHKYYALQVAVAGKPCCIEKPMAPSYADCLDILAAFERNSLPLFVAYYRRSLPRFNQIKQWLESGAIGTPRHIEWHLVRPPSAHDINLTYHWRTDANIAYGGYFDDLAAHGLDLFIYLLGDIAAANGQSVNQQNLYTANDSVTGSWRHVNNVTGCGYWNFGCFADEDRVNLYGSAGKIEFSIFKNEPLVLVNPEGQQALHIDNPENIQLHHVRNIKEHLFSGRAHPSTGKTATQTAWLMDRILGKG